jgi:hypothetical protein
MVSCRDYRSPLVLYFDERRPEFSALTPFKLYGVEQIYSWPEAGAPGSFLALDQNRDGIISNGEELFGDNPATGMRNGFQSLAQHDSNKDGVIDSKDPIWNSLLLWSDRNADGRGRGAELTALPKSPVQSINLRYVSGHTRLMGTGVEGREYSTFVFADEDGRSKHGQIIDLYFEQQPPKRQMASQ